MFTHPDYQKRGIASMQLQWGCDEADKAGQECYLDASPVGKSLYEKFGYVAQTEHSVEGAGVPMLRGVTKTSR